MRHTLPPGWEEKTLGEVCEIERGGSPRPIKSYLTTAPNGLNWIKIGDTSPNSKYIYSVKEKIRPEGLAKSRWVQEGDFLLSNSMSFGRPYILKTNGCIHDGWLVLKQYQSNLQCDFLYYLLSSPFVQKQFQQSAQGSTVRNLNTQRVAKIIIPIPPLLEQKRIVEKLDKIFAAIDKAKSQTEKNLQNTKEIFQRQLDKVLFPRTSWKKLPLSGVCDVRDGTHDSPQYIKEGFPLVTSKNLKHGKLSFDNVKYISRIDYEHINERSKVDIGDVLFAMIGTIGNPVVVTQQPHYAIKNVALFKHSNEILPIFLKYFLSSNMVIEKMQKEANGTTQKFVSLGYLRKFPIFLPSISEQQEIISQLDSLNSKTQELEKIYTQKLADLEELKQAVLQQAFSGKL